MSKAQWWGLVVMILLTCLVIVLGHRGVDCSDPRVWESEAGVRVCAVDGGK